MPVLGIEPLTTLMVRFADRFPGMSCHVDGVFTPGDVVNGVRSGTAEIGLLGCSGHSHHPRAPPRHLHRDPSPWADSRRRRVSRGRPYVCGGSGRTRPMGTNPQDS
jgi:hypothetical protein